jgi:hypothetical protein
VCGGGRVDMVLNVQLYFVFGYPMCSALFVEKYILSLLNSLGKLSKTIVLHI